MSLVLDRYLHRQSLIHQLDPRIKLIVTVAFIVSNVLLPDGAWLAFLAAWGLTMNAHTLSKQDWLIASLAFALLLLIQLIGRIV